MGWWPSLHCCCIPSSFAKLKFATFCFLSTVFSVVDICKHCISVGIVRKYSFTNMVLICFPNDCFICTYKTTLISWISARNHRLCNALYTFVCQEEEGMKNYAWSRKIHYRLAEDN